jgi:uncharacterized protein YfkK (UPF0435 family)
MLNLYKRDFESATSGSKPKHGSHGLVRPASLTEFFDDVLKLLYHDAARIKKHTESGPHPLMIGDPVFREFDFGGMKVVVVDPKHYGQRIREYVKYVERAYKDIKRKGFSKLWYGVLFLMSDDYEKLSQREKEAYEKAGYRNLERRAGTYHSGSDIIRISAPPTHDVIRTIAHELGHRYWFKVMTQAQRARFESLIEGDLSMLHALLLNQDRLDEHEVQALAKIYEEVERGVDISVEEKDIIRKRFRDLGLKAGVPLVSKYAASRPTEAFAEVFERYVDEVEMTRDQIESFRSVLSDRSRNRVVARLLKGRRRSRPVAKSRGAALQHFS